MKKSENKNVYTLKNVQLVCPNCKYEFPYNKSALDKKINKLGELINKNVKLIKTLKKLPDEIRNDNEIKILQKELSNYELMIFDLKQKRENLKQEEDRNVYENLKIVVKEFYGEKEYKRCIDEALRRSVAYDTEDIMSIGYYSKSDGKHIKKV